MNPSKNQIDAALERIEKENPTPRQITAVAIKRWRKRLTVRETLALRRATVREGRGMSFTPEWYAACLASPVVWPEEGAVEEVLYGKKP